METHVVEAMTELNGAETLDVFRHVFGTDEPVAAHLGLDKECLRSVVETSFYKRCATDKASTIVRETSHGRIVGFRLAADFAHQAAGGLQDVMEQSLIHAVDHFPRVASALLRPFFGLAYELALYSQLEHLGFQDWTRRCCPPGLDPRAPGAVLKMAGVGMLPAHRGLGLGRLMTEHTQALARAAGYQVAVVQCTGRHSQRLFEQLGYLEYRAVEYDRFRFGGRCPLAGCRTVDGGDRERYARYYQLDLTALEPETPHPAP